MLIQVTVTVHLPPLVTVALVRSRLVDYISEGNPIYSVFVTTRLYSNDASVMGESPITITLLRMHTSTLLGNRWQQRKDKRRDNVNGVKTVFKNH